MYRRIKSALDAEDVEGLLAMGCPTDEYDSEASLIENEIAKASDYGKRPIDIAQVASLIRKIWDDQFGPFAKEELEKRHPAFASIAKKIVDS